MKKKTIDIIIKAESRNDIILELQKLAGSKIIVDPLDVVMSLERERRKLRGEVDDGN